MGTNPDTIFVRATAPLAEGYAGRETVQLVAFKKGDPQYQRPDSRGNMRDAGIPLAELRKSARDDIASLTSPISGKQHQVSISQWATADPNETLIQIQWGFYPDPTADGKRPRIEFEDPNAFPQQSQ